MTSDFDYKKYSLEKLQEWVHDAMSGDASPNEIYSAIREAVREDYYYHKDRTSRANELLAILNGNGGYDKIKLTCDKDDPSPECQNAWNDFWGEHYYPEEVNKNPIKADGYCVNGQIHSEYYYDYIRNDPNLPNLFVDKVKKWVFPVEECKNADTDETEYFISFPDDLLEAANLKEGDFVEWVDQGDGSYLLKKHIERFKI